MKTAYIFHDAFCDQFSDWYPWMKTTLEARGYFVVVPPFPTPAGQSYESWKAVLRNYLDTFTPDTIIIGHGTGGLFALRFIQDLPGSIAGLFLVASYAEKIGHIGYDRINETFFAQPISWEKITGKVPIIAVFAGEKDPFVPEQISKNLADQLKQELQIIPGGEHLNKAAGFTQLVAVANAVQDAGRRLDKSIQVEVEPSPALQAPSPKGRGTDLPIPAQIPESDLLPLGEGAPRNRGADEGKVHTMYQDMSSLVNSNQGSVASSLLTKARTDTATKKAAAPTSPKNIFYLLGTLAAFLMILGIATFLFQKYSPAIKRASNPAPASLILAERHIPIDISNKEPYVLSKNIRDQLGDTTPDRITDLYYMNGSFRASFTSVLSKLDITIPEKIAGEFLLPQLGTTPLFMHGAGTIDGVSTHFLVLPVSHYDAAFTAMKEWEPTMLHDVGMFMNIPDTILKTMASRDVFTEQVINNRIVHIRKTEEGGSDLAYFFLTERIVVITDQVSIIPELLKRFANSQIYRPGF